VEGTVTPDHLQQLRKVDIGAGEAHPAGEPPCSAIPGQQLPVAERQAPDPGTAFRAHRLA